MQRSFDNRRLETTDLARRSRRGDSASFKELFERLAPAIYAFACARVAWRWQNAEDVVAETWLRAWRRFGDYDPSRSFRSWIFGFATRVVMETQRRLAHEADIAPGEPVDPADQPAEATSVSRRVAENEALRDFVLWARGLSEYEREVLMLRGLQGLPHEQVASALGRSVQGAKECWRRVRRKLESREADGRSLGLAGDDSDSPGGDG